MTEPDHDRIEELLAGYALDALSGADADEAERLLAEHVPGCLTCRRLLEDFRSVVGDLALAPRPEDAPELTLRRLRRDLARERAPRRGMPAWVGAAAAVAVLALGGMSAFLSLRMGDTSEELGRANRAVGVLADPASRIVPMESDDAGDAATVAWQPGETCVIVVEDVARPRRQHPYEVWLTVDGRPELLVGDFFHRRPQTFIEIGEDLTGFDGIWIAEGDNDPAPPSEPVMTAEL